MRNYGYREKNMEVINHIVRKKRKRRARAKEGDSQFHHCQGRSRNSYYEWCV